MKWKNRERLQRRLRALAPTANAEVEKANRKTAEEIGSTAQRFAESSRRTGALIDSIVITYAGQPTPAYSQPGGAMVVPEGAAAVTVGNTNVRYPHLVEYGTQQAMKQPFFWPAVRVVAGPGRRRHKGRVTRALNKSIKQAARTS